MEKLHFYQWKSSLKVDQTQRLLPTTSNLRLTLNPKGHLLPQLQWSHQAWRTWRRRNVRSTTVDGSEIWQKRLELYKRFEKHSNVFFWGDYSWNGCVLSKWWNPGNMDDTQFVFALQSKIPEEITHEATKTWCLQPRSFPFWNSIFSPCFRCSMPRQSITYASTKRQPTTPSRSSVLFCDSLCFFVAAIELGVGTNINVWHEQRLWNFIVGLPVRQDRHWLGKFWGWQSFELPNIQRREVETTHVTRSFDTPNPETSMKI